MKSRRGEILASILGGLLFVLITPSAARAAPADNPGVNTNPEDFTTMKTFKDNAGNDVKLRIGQLDDDVNHAAGWGYKHIIKKHGHLPSDSEIQAAIGTRSNCKSPFYGRWNCVHDSLLVAYDTTIRSASKDGKFWGIITIYYTSNAGCGC